MADSQLSTFGLIQLLHSVVQCFPQLKGHVSGNLVVELLQSCLGPAAVALPPFASASPQQQGTYAANSSPVRDSCLVAAKGLAAGLFIQHGRTLEYGLTVRCMIGCAFVPGSMT